MSHLLLVLAFLLFQGESDTIIRKLQDKFESIKYLQADFSQGINSENFLSGKFYFLKENNYRLVLPNNIIISDGTSIWNDDTKRNKVVVSNVDEDPLAFSLSEYIYEYPSKCSITEEKQKDGFLLILTVKDTELNFKLAKLWISNDYLIQKIVVTDFGGNLFTLQFSNIEIDKSIDKSLFKFIDDGNKKLIDLR